MKPRYVLITGVTRGCGRAMVSEFARLGHTVFGCGRSAESIRDLTVQFPAPHRFEVVDLTVESEVVRWISGLVAAGHTPDLVLNNAAIINRSAPLWEVPAEEFDAVIDINIKGTTNVLRHVLPPMVQLRRGVVVNFSSGWGRSVSAEMAPYCATKWAIEGLTQALAQELPAGMAAVPVNPGIIQTEMLRSCFGSAAAGYPPAESWAKRAVPFLLRLGPDDNGQPLTAPA